MQGLFMVMVIVAVVLSSPGELPNYNRKENLYIRNLYKAREKKYRMGDRNVIRNLNCNLV